MGCDIHLHTEVKIDGVWHHMGAPSVPRSYRLFAKMAGVRGAEAPIAEPRGLPDDATPLTRLDFARWGRGAHTPSWLGAAEIAELQDWLRDSCDQVWPERDLGWGYLFGNSWGGFFRYPESRPEGLEDVRFVFWFDN